MKCMVEDVTLGHSGLIARLCAIQMCFENCILKYMLSTKTRLTCCCVMSLVAMSLMMFLENLQKHGFYLKESILY